MWEACAQLQRVLAGVPVPPVQVSLFTPVQRVGPTLQASPGFETSSCLVVTYYSVPA